METILINGYTGKLGQAICKALKGYRVIGCNRSHPLQEALIHKPDMILDVTSAKIIHDLIPIYLSLKIPTIIGTSGISPELAYKTCKQADFPLLIVPHFSLSFQRFATICLSLKPNYQSIEIIETHHVSKVDSPSGTSLFLANLLNTSQVTSKRIDQYIAKHEVIFKAPHHSFSLSHTVNSKEEFMPGVLKAIEKLKQQCGGLVVFSDQ